MPDGTAFPSGDAAGFFGDPYGTVATGGRLSRLAHRYPRKVGRPLDRLYDARLAAAAVPGRLAREAARWPERRRILVVGVEVPSRADWMAGVRRSLAASRHDVTVATKPVEDRSRLDNLNLLLARHDLAAFDWVVATDDDVELPAGFLDTFVHVLERFGLALGQPAHRFDSFASFEINRRAWGTVARQTAFVEVGPLVAFHRRTFPALLPFPAAGMGYGLDVHWAFVAKQEGWPVGVVDATPIRHLRPVGSGYDTGSAQETAVAFLAQHGGLPRREALRTLRSFHTV